MIYLKILLLKKIKKIILLSIEKKISKELSVGSRYFISLKIENPVPVNPEIDSNIEFKNVT